VLWTTDNRFYLPNYLPPTASQFPKRTALSSLRWPSRQHLAETKRKQNAKYSCLPVGRLFVPTATAKTMTYQGRI